jgi:UDP-N-acetylmuramoyl-L-alanyl-D-glutamate--2,6-diaminopimelate ligase
VAGPADVRVRGVQYDSRRVLPGDIFVALPGSRTNGTRFVADAVARGAVAIASADPTEPLPQVALIRVLDARAALADLASALYGHPARAMYVVGVTGTDGKTTVTRLLAEILERAGRSVGWLTTVDVKVGSRLTKNAFGHTTPEAPDVQRTLAEMRDAGVHVAVLEASSHALAQERLRGCAFQLGVFTNLAPEHLNFHGGLDAYRDAKARLFEFESLRHAVLNADDPASQWMARRTRAAVHTYALDAPADLRGVDVESRLDGMSFTLLEREGLANGLHLVTRFPGRFNAYNWLAAALAARQLGATDEALVQTAHQAAPPPGRMQAVDAGQPFRVIVDFSHTPHALENALRALRPHVSGRLLAAFGHAGERDPWNRPAMGAAGARYADYFAITTDDPMDESPADISASVKEGALALGKREGTDFAVILDREEAFLHLFERAGRGDCVLLAGRGHEDSMPVAGIDHPFNDERVARRLLAQLGYVGEPP